MNIFNYELGFWEQVPVTCGDRRMLKAYQQGRDLHALTASLITGKPLSGITAAISAASFGNQFWRLSIGQ